MNSKVANKNSKQDVCGAALITNRSPFDDYNILCNISLAIINIEVYF